MSTQKKARGGASAAPPPGPQDVPHEVVPTTNGTDIVPAEVLTPQDQINLEITKFNFTDAAIEELHQQYGGLTIKGPDDKQGYEAVKKAWTLVRSKRTGVENKGLDLRRGYTVITKAIKEEEDRLISKLKPLETKLESRWKDIDAEKERNEQFRREQEEEQFRARVQELLNFGAQLNGGFYEVGGTVSIDVATLRIMTPEQYEKFKVAAERRGAEVKQEEAAKADEQQRLRDELQRQQEELEAQQREFDKQRADFATLQESIKEQQRQLLQEKRDRRVDRILGLGMHYDATSTPPSYVYDNGWSTVRHGVDILDLDDYGFEEHLKVLAGYVEEAKQKWEQHKKEVAEEEKKLKTKLLFIDDQMVGAGFTYSRKNDSYVFENQIDRLEFKIESELIPLEAEQLTAFAQAALGKVRTLKLKAEELRKEEEMEEKRQEEALLSDKQKIVKWLEGLRAVPVPALETDEARVVVADFRQGITSLLNDYIHEQP